MDWTVNDWVGIIINLIFAICLLFFCVIVSKDDKWESKKQRVDFIKSLVFLGIAITIMSSVATFTDITVKIVIAIIFLILFMIYRIKAKSPPRFTLIRLQCASGITLSTIIITIAVYGIVSRFPFFS